MVSRTIFISYTHTDEEWAKLIGGVLEEIGHTVIAMYKAFAGDFQERINEAFDACDDFILIFSPLYEKSGQCKHERHVALNREFSKKPGTVHLVKVDPYTMHESYSVMTYIDLSAYPIESPEVITYFRNEIEKRWGSISKTPPTYHNLPSRTPNFTGRKLEIEILHRDFFSGVTEKRIHILSGLGGVGKTKLSLEYAYKFLDQYTLIWFLHAEDPTQLRQEITCLAQTLNLPDAQSDNSDQHLNALKKYLETRDKWLLIFDNAEGPSEIKDLLPSVLRGHVLITSRNPIWGSIACVQHLDKFTKDESVGFLIKRLNRTKENLCLGMVADRLGQLPLALNIAAAFMDTNQISCDDYKTILDNTPDVIFEDDLTDEDRPLLKVWGLSLDIIKKKSYQSGLLLEYLCNFSPDEIPEDILYPMLQTISDMSDLVKQKKDYYKILSLLFQYSFVTKNNEYKTLNMHRLVQEGIRHMMDLERKKQQVAELVSVFSQQFPIKSTDPETIDFGMWQKCRQMLPHAIKVAGIAENLKVAPEPTIHLYAQVASFLRELNNLKESEHYADKALSLIENSKRNETLLHAICLETRARILRDIGRNDEAKDLMLRVITIEEELQKQASMEPSGQNIIFDPAHLAVCYDGYGRILSNLCQDQQSLDYYTKALNLDIRNYEENHPKIAIRKNNIGCAYGRLGNDEMYIKYLNESLSIDEKYYSSKNDPDHPHIAIRLCNLALAYEKNLQTDPSSQNRSDLAYKYWERARKINEQFYGLSSQHTLSSIYGLAGHFCIRNEYEKALMHNNEAIEITRNSDPDGFYHAQSYLYRGNTFVEMGNFTAAISDYQKASELVSCSRGTDCLDYSIILRNIAYSRFREGDYPAAAQMQQKSLEIDTKNNRTAGSGYGIALLNLGIYCIQSQYTINAKNAFFKALPVLEKEFGTYSENYLYALCRYLELKIQLKDTADISELIQKGQRIQEYFEKQHTKGN
jgi:tetratricopeptide (TPR) repeat protein